MKNLRHSGIVYGDPDPDCVLPDKTEIDLRRMINPWIILPGCIEEADTGQGSGSKVNVNKSAADTVISMMSICTIWRGVFLMFFLRLSTCFAGDSIEVAPAVKYPHRAFHSILFGRHYRSIWNLPVKVEVFDIGREHGGLVPVKKGGSYQTQNLRLVNSQGKEFVLRSVVKDPARAFPPLIRNSFMAPVMRDQNTAENPFAPLIIPDLADAAGVYHTNPKLVYIPYDERFGPFAEDFGCSLALFEERPDGDHSGEPWFGNAPRVVGTKKMLRKVYEDNRYRVDQRLYLRSRMFDMLISDWGRHEDQWRWGMFEAGEEVVVKPIPRDRDHAFYLFEDGFLPWLYVNCFGGKFQSFTPHYRDIRKLNESAGFLDRRFLNGLDREEWQSVARELAAALPDSVIEKAVKKLPAEIYAKVGAYTVSTLKHRRNRLEKAAMKYYDMLGQDVTIAGSDEAEKFLIERSGDGHTMLTVLRAPSGDTLYHRVFDYRTTRHLRIFGLGGRDTFLLNGKARRGARIEVTGGEGEKVYHDRSGVRGISKKNLYIGRQGDLAEGEGNESRILFPPPCRVPRFDRKGFKREAKRVGDEE